MQWDITLPSQEMTVANTTARKANFLLKQSAVVILQAYWNPYKKNQDSVTPNVWIKHPAVVAGPRSWASPRETSFTHKWVLWRLKQRNCSQVASSKLDINQITELSNARLTVFYSMGEGSRHCYVCLGNYRNHIPEKYTNSLLFIEQP